MGYEITKENVARARQRVEELDQSRIKMGIAIDEAESIPKHLWEAAAEMKKHPDANRVISFASDFQKLEASLRELFVQLEKDRRILAAAIRKYEKGENGHDC